MSRHLVLLGALLLIALPLRASDAEALLKAADASRLSADSVQVLTEVAQYRNGVLDKERRYAVFVKPGRRSLVVSRHPSEQGQKVLMLGERFWIILPNTRRAVRITPLQRLLGEASTGDVATLTWSEDYRGEIVGPAEAEGVPAIHLSLTARRGGVSYPRVELYLAERGHTPLRAELHVASGKLAKRATFTVAPVEGRLRVTEMTLEDAIQPGRSTVVRYLSVTPMEIPDRIYNPDYLVRSGTGDW
jgi:hypothetical protein